MYQASNAKQTTSLKQQNSQTTERTEPGWMRLAFSALSFAVCL
jgi:hypothetical protein